MTTQEAKKQANQAQFWNQRQQAADNNRDLANVMIDRARSLASKANKNGDTTLFYSLAETLHAWCASRGG